MNDFPTIWAQELMDAYPKRSGPCGWGGQRLFLACRRALMDHTWEQIIDGCKRYKAYCQVSGREHTEFILKPQKFIEDGCYKETFEYRAPEKPEVIEHKRQEAERFNRAVEAGIHLGLKPMPGECAAAFESRIAIARTRGPDHAPRTPSAGNGHPGTDGRPALDGRIADLTARMRAK